MFGQNLSRAHRTLILTAILLLAAGMRFWRLDVMPPGLYHDEAYNGLDAVSLLQEARFPLFYEGWELYAQDAHQGNPPQPTRWPLFFEGNYGREPLHVYLMALSIKLLGVTPLAVRAVPAAAGVLAVWTTYLAAMALFKGDEENAPTAVPLLAALVVAILFAAVHFSRFGLRAMLFVPVETMAVYCFWQGLQAQTAPMRQRIGWLAAAGFFIGAGLYVYAAARLFPLVFAAFVLVWFARERAAVRRYGAAVAVMGLTAVLVAAPLLLFFAQYPYFFIFRTAYVVNKGKGTIDGRPWLTWLLNVGRVFRGLFWLGETHLRHNLPGRPYLDPIQASFFVIGGGRLLRYGRQPRHFFLLLWLVVMLLPTILSGDAPHFGRMTGAVPVVAVFTALGIQAVWRWGQRVRPGRGFLVSAAVWLLLVGSAGITAAAYFGRYAHHPDLATDFYLADWQLGQLAAAQPDDTSLFLTPTQEEMATIYFALGGDRARLQSYSGGSSLLPLPPPGQAGLYLVRPADEAALATLRAFFPGGVTQAVQAGVMPFAVTADATRQQPQQRSTHTWQGQIGLYGWSREQQGQHLTVTLFWQAQAAVDLDYTAYVHVLDGQGTLITQDDHPPVGYPTSDWRVGEIVVATYTMTLPENLAAYGLQTGFYYLPTLAPLGEAVPLVE